MISSRRQNEIDGKMKLERSQSFYVKRTLLRQKVGYFMMNALTQYVLNRSTLNDGFINITYNGRAIRHQYYKCYFLNSQEQELMILF